MSPVTQRHARIAWLSAETPDRGGGGGHRRQYHQIRALLDAGVEVRVATLEGEQDDGSLREVVRVERFGPPRRNGLVADPTLDRFLESERFDGAVVAHIESLPLVQRALTRHRLPWLLDFQNVNSRWHRQRREPAKALAWVWRERAAVRRASLATACSREERDALLTVARHARVEVAGNGIAPEEWPDEALAVHRPPLLALFSSWTHGPNREGAEWLAREVWPVVHSEVPRARLILAGPGQPPSAVLDTRGIEHLGRVDDLAGLLGSVRVAVVPTITGIGARVKFGESLVSGAAVVSTSCGAEGFEAEGCFVRADGPEAFAQACIALLREPKRASALGHAGRRHALQRLTWQQTSTPLVRWAQRCAYSASA